jgi:hypothetical protein
VHCHVAELFSQVTDASLVTNVSVSPSPNTLLPFPSCAYVSESLPPFV